MTSRATAIFVSLALGACSRLALGPEPEEAVERVAAPDCKASLPGFVRWSVAHRAHPASHRNTLAIAADGDLSWNGASLGGTLHGPMPAVSLFLETVRQFDPQPVTLLVVDPAAPCATANRIRALMRQSLACSATTALCAEERAPFRP